MVHRIKITEERCENIRRGNKKAEIRFNDRDYQKGDDIELMKMGDFVAQEDILLYEITHIHSGLGLAEGYVCLSIVECKGE